MFSLTTYIKIGNFFVDQEFSNPKRVKVNASADSAKKDFKLLLNVFNQLQLKYFVSHGTCLGIVRSGNLIAWDEDADIAVLSSAEVPNLLNLIRESLISAGFRVTKYNSSGSTICVTRSGFIIDINLYKKHGPFLVSRLHYDFITTRRIIGDPKVMITQFGRLKVPEHTEKYLKSLYGTYWRHPKVYSFKLGKRYFHIIKKLFFLLKYGMI